MTESLFRRRRLDSGKSDRVGSGGDGVASRQLRNTISHLQQKLLHSKAETQKATDQLNCLITLVKRAWVGDTSASIHVANIVGVAPPDYYEDDPRKLKAVPKSRPLNNWAVLAIGLLNKEYTRLEQIAENKQRRYLQNRQAYLDEQLIFTRNLQTTEIFRDGNTDCSPSGTKATVKAFQRVKSGTTRSLGKPLYRNPPQTPNSDPTDLTLADLVQNPSSSHGSGHSSNHVFDSLSKLKSTSQGPPNEDKKYCMGPNIESRSNYADPMKYLTFGLYDSELAVTPNAPSTGTRPTSAAQQKSDAARARPKSSVLPKGERPMKYETTRPVSAQLASRRPYSGKPNIRPSNGIAKDKVFLTLASEEGDNENDFKRKPKSYENNKNDVETENNEKLEEFEFRSAKPLIDVRIKRPQHVDTFVNDLKSMEKMESDFKTQLEALQKKLGISDGVI